MGVLNVTPDSFSDGGRFFDTDKAVAHAVLMAAEGADLLVLHENWRTDPQNGSVPYDDAEFRRLMQTAHRHGLRVAPYIRGNEISIREDRADWFDEFFRRDYDGLYMDYGTPICYSTGLDEIYPGGRIGFREYYLAMRELRRHRANILPHRADGKPRPALDFAQMERVWRRAKEQAEHLRSHP